MFETVHGGSCACAGCAGLIQTGLRRRGLFRVALAGAAASFVAGGAQAQQPPKPASPYQAMLLSCIDPRFVTPTYKYMDSRYLSGKYSQFSFAGAAVGVVAPKFQGWHDTFWDNLAASIQLHRITMLIAINHEDCGAAGIAYGPQVLATPQAQLELHRRVMAIFRQEALKRHPDLQVETHYMSLNGQLTPLA